VAAALAVLASLQPAAPRINSSSRDLTFAANEDAEV